MADKKLLLRLARLQGQVRSLTAMIEEGRYCLDVVTQIRAARAGLARVEQILLANHMAHCVEGAVASGNPEEQRKKMAELVDLLRQAER